MPLWPVAVIIFLVLMMLLRPHDTSRPDLRDCFDAMAKEELRGSLTKRADNKAPIAEFFNGFCGAFYWRAEENNSILEAVDMNISGLIGAGHGVIKIFWLNGDVKGWFHNKTPLPPMTVGDNFISYQILEIIRSGYLRIKSQD